MNPRYLANVHEDADTDILVGSGAHGLPGQSNIGHSESGNRRAVVVGVECSTLVPHSSLCNWLSGPVRAVFG
jgi:hypothetical protein